MTKLETRSTVGLRPPDGRTWIPGPIRGVSAHYNGPAMKLAGKPHSECRRRWRGTQNYHMSTNGWDDVAYSAAVCHHDIVMEGRGKNIRTAANGTTAGNNSWYAIFFMVGGNEHPSVEMIRAANWYATNRLGVSTWNRHSDHKSTACPGQVGGYISGGRLTVAGAPGGDGGTRTLGLDDEGPDVRAWQQDLMDWNSNALPRYGADGDFGDETDEWTRRFQRAAGIKVDGLVGPTTRAAMDDALPGGGSTGGSSGGSTGTPFSDMSGNHRFAAAAEWAADLINMGFPDGTFRPDQPVTRGQFAALLKRYHRATGGTRDSGGGSSSGDATFSDMSGNHRFADAAAWAADIINMGFPDGTFRPDEPVTRGAFAALLQRYHRAT